MTESTARAGLHYDRITAARVQYERERRGMSYEALAAAVTAAGCHMYPSTPFKIEKGDPPRKITVDEFVAFSKVFDLTLDELLIDPETAADEAFTQDVDRMAALWERGGAGREVVVLLARLAKAAADPEQLNRQLKSKVGDPTFPLFLQPPWSSRTSGQKTDLKRMHD